MMVITSDRMREFADGLTIAWVRASLLACYPDREELDERRIAASMRDGRRRGFESPDALRRYTHLAFLLDWQLESEPGLAWAREMLSDDTADVTSRLLALQQAVLERLPESHV